MRKNIDLSGEIVKALSIQAIENGTNFKNYVEAKLEELSKEGKKNIKKTSTNFKSKRLSSMTEAEFDKQVFGAGDKARYTDGQIYDVATVDFQERLIGLLMHISGAESEDEVSWVRCENVEYMSPNWRPENTPLWNDG